MNTNSIIATAKAFPLYSIVRVTKSLNPMKGGYLWNSPFKDRGTFHVVTGYHNSGDLILDNTPMHSVSLLRVEVVDASIYAVTDKMTEDLGGTLGTLPPGERFAVIYGTEPGQYSAVIKYLDRKTPHPHYTDSRGKWIHKLLKAGAIVKGSLVPAIPEDEPQEFNSVFDAPLGMVLAYKVKGEMAEGAMYPYLMRSSRGLWVYAPNSPKTTRSETFGGWDYLRSGNITREAMPYIYDLQNAWDCKAAFVEVFEYPEQAGGLDKRRNELIEESNDA